MGISLAQDAFDDIMPRRRNQQPVEARDIVKGSVWQRTWRGQTITVKVLCRNIDDERGSFALCRVKEQQDKSKWISFQTLLRYYRLVS